jgi:hypothetical protein
MHVSLKKWFSMLVSVTCGYPERRLRIINPGRPAYTAYEHVLLCFLHLRCKAQQVHFEAACNQATRSTVDVVYYSTSSTFHSHAKSVLPCLPLSSIASLLS